MKSSHLNWRGGQIRLWDLDCLVHDLPMRHQKDIQKEDLAQIVYRNGHVIDVGWYPSTQPDGCFVVYVVRSGDWDQPVARTECVTVQELRDTLENAIEVVVGRPDTKI